MEALHINGLVVATFTPMTAEGEIDFDRIDAYCQFLFEEGLRQIYINGTNGEGPSLTTEERMRLTERWVKEGRKDGRIQRIMVQVGGASLKDTIMLVKHAAGLGVDAISSLPSIYYPTSSVKDLVDYCKLVADAAPDTPFYYYHIPLRSGVNLPMDEFLQSARDVIPSLRGIKFTDIDLFKMSNCLRTKDAKGRNFNILYGRDEQLLAGMALGADGAVGSTFNWMAGLYRRLVALLKKGDLNAACVEQYRSQDVISEFFKFGQKTNGNLSTQKVIMKLVGFDVGPTRPPMKTLHPKDEEEFFRNLKDMGLLQWRKE